MFTREEADEILRSFSVSDMESQLVIELASNVAKKLETIHPGILDNSWYNFLKPEHSDITS